MSLAITIGFLVLAAVVAIAVWKFGQELAAIRQQGIASQAMASEVASIKTQMQNLPAALGDLGAIKSQVESLSGAAQSIGGIKSQVETLSTSVQELTAIKSGVDLISQTVQQIGAIKADLEGVKKVESQVDGAIRTILSKLVGTRDVGDAGENILAEVFDSFPPGLIERDFKVGGKVVEFALVLPNQKRLPIDSKFPAAQLLEQLGRENDLDQRAKIIRQIEEAVISKSREAAKYIDPSHTIYLAIAAVPDAAYSVCRKAHYEAIKSHVLVTSYSLTVHIVLALYKFQLQYATSIDQQNLELHLRNVENCLNAIEKELQNSISRAGSMVNNACAECMTQIGKVRASLSALRTPALPATEHTEEELTLHDIGEHIGR